MQVETTIVPTTADNNVATTSNWLNYFRSNAKTFVPTFNKKAELSEALRIPLIRSLQRFQIGETGEGKFLRRFAAQTGDGDYEQCIDLFIKEEQSHARILAAIIASMDGTLLTWHWSDLVFIALRRMLGLKTELLILLIAEIVGKCFYMQCAQKLEDNQLSNAFSLIVLDEIAHLRFHCEFLQSRLAQLSPSGKALVYWGWSSIFTAACLVFVADHGGTLHQLGATRRQFLDECHKEFRRAGQLSLGI